MKTGKFIVLEKSPLYGIYYKLLVNSHSLYNNPPQILASGCATNTVINAVLR